MSSEPSHAVTFNKSTGSVQGKRSWLVDAVLHDFRFSAVICTAFCVLENNMSFSEDDLSEKGTII